MAFRKRRNVRSARAASRGSVARHRATLSLALIVGAVVPAVASAQSCVWTKDNVSYSSVPFVYTATNFSPPSIDFTGTKTGDLLTPLQAVTVTSPVV